MGTVCFIVDASVTGALLPRHLRSIRQSGLADHALPIIVTCAHSDERLTDLEKRYHAHGLVTPAHTLGARLNQAAYLSQADWLLIALHKEPMAAQLWYLLYPQLDTATDALLINAATPLKYHLRPYYFTSRVKKVSSYLKEHLSAKQFVADVIQECQKFAAEQEDEAPESLRSAA